jgi:hypothetical protein
MTRGVKGNGPGWGGPAKGAGSKAKFDPAKRASTPELNSNSEVQRQRWVSRRDLSDDEQVQTVLDRMYAVALDPTHAHSVMAQNNFLDRKLGKPEQSLQHAGKGGGPIVYRWASDDE